MPPFQGMNDGRCDMNSDEIIAEVNELESLFLQCRSVFPFVPETLIGHSEFSTGKYYSQRGYNAHIQLEGPISAAFIERYRRIGRWINENAIIRLFGIMHYHGLIGLGEDKKIDKRLPGSKEVDLMRRMRNAFTKTSLGYRPHDQENIDLRQEVINHFHLENEEPTGEEIPTSINTVVQPIFKGCRDYIAAKTIKKGGHPSPANFR
jgi:hypothetical protein